MLSSPDADLCRRDAALAGLRLVLDPEALRAKVGTLGGEIPFASFAPAYLRYKAGTNCLVGFNTSAASEISFYAKVYSPGSGKIRARDGLHSDCGSRFTIPDEAIELVFFPADNRLVLASVFDPASRSRFLSEGVNRAVVPTVTRTAVLAYRPERRCVISTGGGATPTGVVKAYSYGTFQDAVARATALRSVCSPVASFTGVDAGNRLLFFPWIAGKTLQHAIEDGTASDGDLHAAGASLAELHGQPFLSLPRSGKDEEARRMLAIATEVGRLSPGLLGLARRLATRIIAGVDRICPQDATLHGDFAAKQVVLHDGAATLIDLDESTCGNPALDLGNFIAHMEADVLRGQTSGHEISPRRDALLVGYASMKALPSELDITLATAIGLFKVAHEPFRKHLPEWPARILALLRRVEAILGGSAGKESGAAFLWSGTS